MTEERTVEARSARLSLTEMTELVLPQHANALGTVFGGTVMGWIDICGAITAQRHCRQIAVTVAVDDLTFVAPIRVGDLVRLVGRVNAAFRTSVEVEVKVEIEDRHTQQRRLCVEALATFVAVDEHSRPVPVPSVLPENEDDARRAREAKLRREQRLARSKR